MGLRLLKVEFEFGMLAPLRALGVERPGRMVGGNGVVIGFRGLGVTGGMVGGKGVEIEAVVEVVELVV